MDFQQFCELADKEMTLGLADERLLQRALAEANGVEAYARQVYWHLRAKALQEIAQDPSGEAHIAELIRRIESHAKRVRSRKERNRWFWAFICFIAIIGTVLFPRLAISAYARDGFAFFAFAFLGVACLALTVIAYTAARYHTHSE